MLQYFLTWMRTLKREEGQDMAEYALLIALVAVLLVVIVTSMAGGIGTVFNSVKNALTETRTL